MPASITFNPSFAFPYSFPLLSSLHSVPFIPIQEKEEKGAIIIVSCSVCFSTPIPPNSQTMRSDKRGGKHQQAKYKKSPPFHFINA